MDTRREFGCRLACQAIVDLAAGWDKDGAIGPREPLTWETAARAALDYARSALRLPAEPAETPSIAAWEAALEICTGLDAVARLPEVAERVQLAIRVQRGH